MLAGSDVDRIIYEFEDGLNLIVGDRGKGKSALLDAVVWKIDSRNIDDSSRSKFVKKFDALITNFYKSTLVSDINIMYFSQTFINKLFDGDSRQRLESFLRSNFQTC